MTRQAHQARVELAEAADRLIHEVASGKWDHLPEVRAAPVGEWPHIVHALSEACPGFSVSQYQQALRRSFRDNR